MVRRPHSHECMNGLEKYSSLYNNRVINVVLCFLIILGCGDKPSEKEPSSFVNSEVSFTDITLEAGLGDFKHENGAFGEKWFPEPMGSGGGFIDYNGDFWEDILLVGGGVWSESGREKVPALHLYRNNGNGTFTEVTSEVGLNNIFTYPFGITVADYDNDNDQDFFLTTIGKNLLFENHGGRFEEVGENAGLQNYSTLSSSAIFFDADRDGWLDLYTGNYIDWSPETDVWCSFGGKKGYCTPEVYEGFPSRFYRGNGDGTFTDITEEAGFLPAPGKTLGVSQHDYNKDGWPDLAVANDLDRDLLYENNGDGTFTERGMVSGMAFDEAGKARAGMGIDIGITDDTFEETIYIGNFQNEMIGVYRHMGNGFFMDRAAMSRIGRPSLEVLTFGLFLFDVDLEGDLDLFIVNGHIQVEIENDEDEFQFRQLTQLYINKGDETFELAKPSQGSVFSKTIVGRGAAYGDIDRDGDLDILITENSGPAYLWRNDLIGDEKKANFVRVRLIGTDSNRDGLGSTVTVFSGEKTKMQRVRTGSSYLSQSEKTLTFGLGKSVIIDSLEINWTSGDIDKFYDINSNQTLQITEGSKSLGYLKR